MKILFINAINPFAEVQYRFPQLGLGYLAASLRNHFEDIQIRIVDRDVEKELDAFKPEIVGITSVSQNYNYAKQYAKMAKKRGAKVIIGGIHISALPQTMTEDMDVAVMGEGEQTIVELVEALLTQSLLFHGDIFKNIKGIAYRDEGGSLNLTQPREFIEPLDSIPFPARDLLKTGRFGNIFSSRGCPYTCTFCASTRYWNKLRFFSAEYVVAEIKEMVEKYGARRISFYDDLMIADKARLEKMADLIQREPVLDKIKFGINARANLITDYTAEILKAMHVNSVGMGLESGNERTLRYLKGGSVSVEDNYNAVKTLHRYGIAANASFIIGSPDETREEILDTLKFIKTSGLNFVDTFFLTPLPGTPIWEEAKRRGLVSDDMDFSRLNIFHAKDPIIMSERIGRDELLKLHRRFEIARLGIAAKGAWVHPFFGAMVKAGMANVTNVFRRATCSQQCQ
jgi:anaerobic magnesium-protoporphyrin IX monomethyl ester cyclase